MSLMVDTSSAAVEQIQRAALYVLLDTLNPALALLEAEWADSDQEFADRMDTEYVATTLELVETRNFHPGFVPSLISAPVERFPNVAVMALRAVPGPGSDSYDHQESYRIPLVIECMVKAMPDPPSKDLNDASALAAAALVNQRAHRMVEAINACMMRNTTLGGLVSGFAGAPTTSVTELFTRKEKTAYGPHWFWQGGRLEYAVRKEAAMPSHGSIFRSVQREGLDIDQA